MNKNAFGSHFKKIDLFTTDVSFRENGGSSFGSIFGASMSLIIAIVVIIYGASKFTIMLDYEDTTLNVYTVKNELSKDEYDQDEL